MFCQLTLLASFLPMILSECNLHTGIGDIDHELFGSRVISFSSQWNAANFLATQILGQPDVYPRYGDNPNTWCPATRNNIEFIEVEFQEELYIEQIGIYETWGGGGITNISVWNGEYYITVYNGVAAHVKKSRIFAPQFERLTFKSNRVKFSYDSRVAYPDWVEIDAIRIIGSREVETRCQSSNKTLEQLFSKLVNCDKYSDVVLLVEGNVEVYAHKAILASHSSYFNNLFSNMNGHIINVTEIREANYEEVLALLEYIYTGETECNLIVAPYLLKMASKICSSELLIEKCTGKIPTHFTVNNVLDFCLQSGGLAEIREICTDFIAANYIEIIKSNQFAQLPKKVVIMILEATVDKLPLGVDCL